MIIAVEMAILASRKKPITCSEAYLETLLMPPFLKKNSGIKFCLQTRKKILVIFILTICLPTYFFVVFHHRPNPQGTQGPPEFLNIP